MRQVLNLLQAKYFSVPNSNILPEAKGKLQRTSHHYNRLMAEVMQHVQPFSQELQVFLSEEIAILAYPDANKAFDEIKES